MSTPESIHSNPTHCQDLTNYNTENEAKSLLLSPLHFGDIRFRLWLSHLRQTHKCHGYRQPFFPSITRYRYQNLNAANGTEPLPEGLTTPNTKGLDTAFQKLDLSLQQLLKVARAYHAKGSGDNLESLGASILRFETQLQTFNDKLAHRSLQRKAREEALLDTSQPSPSPAIAFGKALEVVRATSKLTYSVNRMLAMITAQKCSRGGLEARQLSSVLDAITSALGSLLDSLSSLLSALGDLLSTILESLCEIVYDRLCKGASESLCATVTKGLCEFLYELVNLVIDILTNIIDTLSGLLDS